jgi:hypothetical protein
VTDTYSPSKEKETEPNKPITMDPKGKTLVFPRKDNVYKKKESLPYDEVQSLIWQTRPRQRKTDHSKEWLAHFLVGLIIGIVGFLMGIMEDALKEFMTETMQDTILRNHDVIKPWLYFAGLASICGICSSIMTTYWGQGAAGSGVAELIGYLNGINYPEFIGI